MQVNHNLYKVNQQSKTITTNKIQKGHLQFLSVTDVTCGGQVQHISLS